MLDPRMNPTPPDSPQPGFNPFLLVLGILFILVWIGVHVVWAALSGMANLMANDSGQASAGSQMILIFGFLAGVIIAGFAGIPAGLAIFWRGKRKLFLILFLGLFLLGAACEAASFFSFFGSVL